MTNAEKFLKDGVDLEEFSKSIMTWYFGNYAKANDFARIKNWAEHKIETLTEDERVILRNTIIDNYKYIHRDENGSLWLTENVWLKPKKDPVLNAPYRESDNIIWFGMYRHLFQFIKEWRRI